MNTEIAMEMLRESAVLEGKLVYSVHLDTEYNMAFVTASDSMEDTSVVYAFDLSREEALLAYTAPTVMVSDPVWFRK